ncbi:MAG: heme b synthase [Spirochaetes bacterium]|nr:MAG: heme b synthase [Spirochaetota bacterium]
MKTPPLRMIAWELTRRCNLSCIHCRALAADEIDPNELTHEEAIELLNKVKDFASPVIILTGGEPMMREDIYEIAEYGTSLGFRMVMAPNGTLITPESVKKMKKAGIKRVSISIDGPDSNSHDKFRGVKGAFDAAMRGISYLKEGGLPFQINTTITKFNIDQIDKILALAISLGAVAHHIFLLVPTGRGMEIKDQSISAQQYEETLLWFYKQRQRYPIDFKATCAPHYQRIIRQYGKGSSTKTGGELARETRGCLAGIGFCFVSSTGVVQPCGYLEINCGNIREKPLEEIWRDSSVFNDLRDYDKLKGKCGICEYRKVCGGCRARAYTMLGDYLAEEPFCTYQPYALNS